jgi:hydroxypyruvate reductase
MDRAAIASALREALGALDPADAVRDTLAAEGPPRGRVLLVAAGKAAPRMAAGALAAWGDRIDEGIVVSTATPSMMDARFATRIAPHPIPDERSEAAADDALARAARLGEGDLLLALISGGASALLAAPPLGITLAEKQALVTALLDRGVPIRAVNLVRRHASRVKGGRLARAAAPARVLALIASDVIAGAPHDIGSGPAVADPTTLEDARRVLHDAGMAAPAWLDESPKPGRGPEARARVVLDPAALGRALGAALARHGLTVEVDPPEEGEAREVLERRIARAARLAPGEAVVVPCEPTIALPARRGRGGRAGWIALAAMRRLPPGVTLLCAASDGVDGSSGAAGAIVCAEDAARIDAGTLDAAIAGYDDAAAHAVLGTHLVGGPTGHNLADVHALIRS